MQVLHESVPFAAAVALAALFTLLILMQIGASRLEPRSQSPFVVQTDNSSQFAQAPGRPF
jgi:hypothetical protein